MPEIKAVLDPAFPTWSSRGFASGTINEVHLGYSQGDVGNWYTIGLLNTHPSNRSPDAYYARLYIDWDFADGVVTTSEILVPDEFGEHEVAIGPEGNNLFHLWHSYVGSGREVPQRSPSPGSIRLLSTFPTAAAVAESVLGVAMRYQVGRDERTFRIRGLNLGTTREERIRRAVVRLGYYDSEGEVSIATLATFDLPGDYFIGGTPPAMPDPTAGLDQVGRVGPLAHDDITQGIEIFRIGRVGPGQRIEEIGRVGPPKLIGRVGPLLPQEERGLIGSVGPQAPVPPDTGPAGVTTGTLRLMVDIEGGVDNPLTMLPGGSVGTDITDRLLSVSCHTGRDSADLLTGVDDGANLTGQLRRLPELELAYPGRAVALWAAGADETWISLWTGYLVDALPHYAGSELDVTRIRAEGPMGWIKRRGWPLHIPAPTLIHGRVDAGRVINALLDLPQAGRMLWPRERRLINPGEQLLNAGGLPAVTGAPRNLRGPLDALRSVARAEGGYCYGDRYGRIVFEGRKTRGRRLRRLRERGELRTLSLRQLHGAIVNALPYDDGIYNIFTGGGKGNTQPSLPADIIDYRENPLESPFRSGLMWRGWTREFDIDIDSLLEASQFYVPGLNYRSLADLEIRLVREGAAPQGILDNRYYSLDVVDSYPEMRLRITGNLLMPAGLYRAYLTHVSAYVQFDDLGLQQVRAENRTSIEQAGPRPYQFGSELYSVEPQSLAAAQAYVDWAVGAFGQPWKRIEVEAHVGGDLGGAEYLRYGVGDILYVDGAGADGEPLLIERCQLTWTNARQSIAMTWQLVDARPYEGVL